MTTHDDVVCPACGCFCDDVQITVNDHHISDIRTSCSIGAEWFRHQSGDAPPAEALLDGRPATRSEAISVVVAALTQAKFPLFIGMKCLDVDGQRALCALADEVGGVIDAEMPSDPMLTFFPTVGTMSCTWGDVIQRADVVVYWDCDPDTRQPRHRERVLDRIRQSREVEVISTGGDFETIWMLRALVQGRPSAVPPSAELQRLANMLMSARYGVIIHDAACPEAVALHALATDVNRRTRCRVVKLAEPGNGAGAVEVLTWQTGYGGSVSFQCGYPNSFATEFSAKRLLPHQEVDCVFSISNSADGLSEKARIHLSQNTHVNLSVGNTESTLSAKATLFSCVPGIHAQGTVFRSDRVTLPLRALVPTSLPSPALVLNEVLDAVRSARPAPN